MKTRFLSTIFFTFFFLGVSQQEKKDSIKSYIKKDSIRVKLLINAAWNIIYTNPEDAFKYVDEAYNVASELKWNKGIVSALRQKGVNYYAQRDYLNAMESWQNALKVARDKKIENKLFVASIHNNLGNVYADFGQLDKALENYEVYLNVAISQKNKKNKINALSNIGYVYLDLKNPDKGIEYFNRALILAKEEDNKFAIAAIINNIGNAYKEKKEYKKSLKYYEESENLASKINNKYVQAPVLNSLCELNIMFNNNEQAKKYGERALKLGEEVNTLSWQSTSWRLLSKIYENEGDNKKALLAYKNFIKLRDSTQSEDKKLELTRKEMSFELENQEVKAKAELEKEKLIKNIVLLCSLVVLIGMIIGYFLYKRRRDAMEQKSIAEFKAKVAETELKALQSQMNPHFIFNALNSIGDYMAKNDIETASEYLIKFSKLIRAILESSEKKRISLEEDLELTRLYVEIESLRLKERIDCIFHIDKDIDVENTMLPPLILQPFIENSIWHGLAPKKGKGNIQINFCKEKDTIICSVDDNGVGRKQMQKKIPNHTSMGVKITKNRLAILNELHSSKSGVIIIDKEEGLKIEVELPLELRF